MYNVHFPPLEGYKFVAAKSSKGRKLSNSFLKGSSSYRKDYVSLARAYPCRKEKTPFIWVFSIHGSL